MHDQSREVKDRDDLTQDQSREVKAHYDQVRIDSVKDAIQSREVRNPVPRKYEPVPRSNIPHPDNVTA